MRPDAMADRETAEQKHARRITATGIAARRADIPKHKCPLYPRSLAADLWHKGWDEEDTLIRNHSNRTIAR